MMAGLTTGVADASDDTRVDRVADEDGMAMAGSLLLMEEQQSAARREAGYGAQGTL